MDNNHLDDAEFDEENFISEVEDTIESTFFQKDSIQLGYVLTNVAAIINNNLMENYRKMNEHLKGSLARKSDFIERYLFYVVKDDAEADLIKASGFACDNIERSELNLLGNSAYGVHLVKHLDIMLRNEYSKRTNSFQVVLAKAAYDINRVGVVSGSFAEKPPPKYQCLIFSSPPNTGLEIQKQNFNSTMFFYEYDANSSIRAQPSNLFPYAMLKFELENASVHDQSIYIKQNSLVAESAAANLSSSLSVSFSDVDGPLSLGQPPLFDFQTTVRNDPVLITKKTTPKKKFSFSKKPIIEDLTPIRSPACQLNRAFLQSSPLFQDSLDISKQTVPIEGQTNKLIPETNKIENLSISRRLIEKYSKVALNKKFQSHKKMLVIITDLTQKKLKFSNLNHTYLDLKLPQNRKCFSDLFPVKKIKSISQKKPIKSSTTEYKETSSAKNNLKMGEKSKSLIVKCSLTTATNETKTLDIKPKSKPSTPQSTKTKPVTTPKLNKTVDSRLIPKSQSEASINKSTPKRDKTLDKSIKKTSTPTTKQTDPKQEAEGASLSSEMTSLEKRLLGLDKTKSLSKIKPNNNKSDNKFDSLSAKLENVTKKTNLNSITQKTKSDVNLKVEKTKAAVLVVKKEPTTAAVSKVPSPKKTTTIKEELKKINAKLSKEKKQRVEENLTYKPNVKVTDKTNKSDPKNVNLKRKKSFWDPDSDTEYDKLIKRPSVDNKPTIAVAERDKIEEDEDLIGDEYVIVSKPHLNVKPVQYSKPFYDLNINGLEHELKKFNDDLSPTSNITITKHIKAPVDLPPDKQQPKNPQQQKRSSNRANYNKQRFIHHYITNTAHQRHLPDGKKPPKFLEIVMNQMNVDSLKQLKTKSKSQIGLGKTGLNDCTEIIRHEIHAGGFRCIEEHIFQRSVNYLRRTQSYSQSSQLYTDVYSVNTLDQWNESQNVNPSVTDNKEHDSTPNMQKKSINLTDYLSLRAKSSRTSTPQATCNSNPNSVNSCEINTQQLNESTEELIGHVKQQPTSPVQVKLSPQVRNVPLVINNSPQVRNVPLVVKNSPVDNKNPPESVLIKNSPEQAHKRTITLSLMDELKKRVGAKKSLENSDENEVRNKSSCDVSDNEKTLGSQRSKSKSRKKVPKKHRSMSKKSKKPAKHHHSIKKRKHHHSSDSSLSLDSSLSNTSSISISSIGTDSLSESESSVSSINSLILSGSDLLTSSSSSPLYNYKSSSSCSNSYVGKGKSKRYRSKKRKKGRKEVTNADGYDDGECTDSGASRDSLEMKQIIKDEDYSLDLDLKDVQMLANTNATSKIKTCGKMYSDYEFDTELPNLAKEISSPEGVNQAASSESTPMTNLNTSMSKEKQPHLQPPRAFYTPNFAVNKSFNDESSHNNSFSSNRNQFNVFNTEHQDLYNKLPGNNSSDFSRSLTENTTNQFQNTNQNSFNNYITQASTNYPMNEGHDASLTDSFSSNYPSTHLAQSTIPSSFPNKTNYTKNTKNYRNQYNKFNTKQNQKLTENFGQMHNTNFNNQFINTSFNQSYNQQQASFNLNSSAYQLNDTSFNSSFTNSQNQFQDYSNLQKSFNNSQNFNDEGNINSAPSQQQHRSNFNNSFNTYNDQKFNNKFPNNKNRNQRANFKSTNKYHQTKSSVKNFTKPNHGGTSPKPSTEPQKAPWPSKPIIDKEDGEID